MAQEIKTTCPYCGVGCGVIARVGDDGAVSVKGDPEHPANFGRLCSKGSALPRPSISTAASFTRKSAAVAQAGARRSTSLPNAFRAVSPSTVPIRLPSTSRDNC